MRALNVQNEAQIKLLNLNENARQAAGDGH